MEKWLKEYFKKTDLYLHSRIDKYVTARKYWERTLEEAIKKKESDNLGSYYDAWIDTNIREWRARKLYMKMHIFMLRIGAI